MRNLKLTTTNLLGELPEIIDITDQLPRKQTWEEMPKKNIVKGVWDGTYHTGYRLSGDINTIVIHHSGSPEASIQSHAAYHSRKWGAGIAYHIVISDGKIYQTNNLLSFTFHCGGHNTYTVGIAINRDLRNEDLTDEERRLLYGAILSVKNVLPITEIKAHKELQPTQCPVTSVDRIRKDIANIEEQMSFHANKDTDTRIYSMFVRMKDLQTKIQENGPYTEEAKRKLLVIDEALTEKGFYR